MQSIVYLGSSNVPGFKGWSRWKKEDGDWHDDLAKVQTLPPETFNALQRFDVPAEKEGN